MLVSSKMVIRLFWSHYEKKLLLVHSLRYLIVLYDRKKPWINDFCCTILFNYSYCAALWSPIVVFKYAIAIDVTWLTKNFSLGTGGSIKFVVAPKSDLFSSAFYEGLFFATCFQLCSHLVSQRNSKWDIWMAHTLPKPGQSCLLSDGSTFGICSNSKTCQIILSFFSVPPPSLCAPVCVCLSPSPSLSLVVNGDVKYLNTLCCAGTMHSSRWTGPARVGCMQISIQSSPGCFQSNTSASGPVLIPLYPQPARFFIKSNAVSAVSTWTSGPTTKPEGE